MWEITLRREAEMTEERRKWKGSDERRWVRTALAVLLSLLITELPWLWLMALLIGELTQTRSRSSPSHICLLPTCCTTICRAVSGSEDVTFGLLLSNSEAWFIVTTWFWSWGLNVGLGWLIVGVSHVVVMVSVRGYGIDYAYESPDKDRSTSMCVCVYMKARTHTLLMFMMCVCDWFQCL